MTAEQGVMAPRAPAPTACAFQISGGAAMNTDPAAVIAGNGTGRPDGRRHRDRPCRHRRRSSTRRGMPMSCQAGHPSLKAWLLPATMPHPAGNAPTPGAHRARPEALLRSSTIGRRKHELRQLPQPDDGLVRRPADRPWFPEPGARPCHADGDQCGLQRSPDVGWSQAFAGRTGDGPDGSQRRDEHGLAQAVRIPERERRVPQPVRAWPIRANPIAAESSFQGDRELRAHGREPRHNAGSIAGSPAIRPR